MAKNFTTGLAGMLQGINAQQEERPTPQPEKPKDKGGRPKKATTERETRATFVIDKELLNELKQVSYAETGRRGEKVLIKDILNAALREYIDKYNRKQK